MKFTTIECAICGKRAQVELHCLPDGWEQGLDRDECAAEFCDACMARTLRRLRVWTSRTRKDLDL